MKIAVSPEFARVQGRYTIPRLLIRSIVFRAFGFHVVFKPDIKGVENVPAAGPTLLMINHIAAIDPLVAMGAVTQRFVVPMSKIENFDNPFFRLCMNLWGVYAIRRGEVDRVALQNTIELLKSGNAVLMAPEGHRQPALNEAKDGVTYVAVKADAMLVPIGIDGTREMLPNLKRLRRTHVIVRFGKPFRFRTNGRERIPRPEMAHMTQEAMYQLAALLPEYRRGFYSDMSKATTETIEFV